ncbi:MAG: ATP-binding protein [Methylovirgula sp.]
MLGDHLQAGIESLGQISDILSRIEDFGARRGLSSASVFHLQLACDEMLTNVISYGFPDARPRDIHVSISLGQDMIETEIIDNGIPFNPLAQPEPDLILPLEERETGGLGIHFVRAVMTRLDYHRSNGRNHLKMVLQLSADPASKGDNSWPTRS